MARTIATSRRRAAWTIPLLALPFVAALPPAAYGQDVSTEAELRSAFVGARPGTVITLADGTYMLSGELATSSEGADGNPIIVRAAHENAAVVVTNGATQAFHVTHPHWRFEGLHVRVLGSATYGYKLEANGHHVTVHGGRIELQPGSECGVKGAGGARAPQPDYAVVEGVEIYMTEPTTYDLAEGIDAVAVRGWIIRNNVIHNLRTAAGTVAFGAMTKGNSIGTIIENNLFYECFISISLGGGGTGAEWLRDGDGTYEQRDGIIRNNVSLDSNDVAVYLYAANNSKVYNNTFFNSFMDCGGGCSSIDVRLSGASADIRNNILDKPINDREGGRHTESSNMMLPSPADRSWFVDAARRNLRLRPGAPPVDQGETLTEVPTDFDGTPRPEGRAFDVGAHELIPARPAAPPAAPLDAGETTARDVVPAGAGRAILERGPASPSDAPPDHGNAPSDHSSAPPDHSTDPTDSKASTVPAGGGCSCLTPRPGVGLGLGLASLLSPVLLLAAVTARSRRRRTDQRPAGSDIGN